MSDKEFDRKMNLISEGNMTLPLMIPNDETIKINLKKLAKSIETIYKFKLFDRSYYINNDGSKFSPKTIYNFMYVPLKRAVQTLNYGRATAKNSKKRNLLTGQVTGDSSAQKTTQLEVNLYTANNLNNTATELMNYRGGDQGAMRALEEALFKQGQVSKHEVERNSTGVQSKATLKSMFQAMHIKTNL